MVLRELANHLQKNQLDPPYLTQYTKIILEQINDLNIRPETLKPLKENGGRALSHSFLKILDTTYYTKGHKTKTNL